MNNILILFKYYFKVYNKILCISILNFIDNFFIINDCFYFCFISNNMIDKNICF